MSGRSEPGPLDLPGQWVGFPRDWSLPGYLRAAGLRGQQGSAVPSTAVAKRLCWANLSDEFVSLSEGQGPQGSSVVPR